MTFSKTLFTPMTTEPLSDATAINDSLACVGAFTNAFNRRDLGAMDALLHFPHVILSAEKLVIWNAPGALPPDFFNDLARETGWAYTVSLGNRAVLVSPCKVHLLVEYSRNREDGAVLSTHSNFWIVTYDSGRWGIKERSY